MRWYWIDRFIEFESGVRARAVKNVSMAEEHIHDHYPGFPVMPGSLIIEGLAQTGGILLGEKFQFDHVVVLAKVPKVKFMGHACPGDQLIYEAHLLEANEEGGMVSCTAKIEDRTVVEAEIIFAHLDNTEPDLANSVDQKNFVFSSGLMSIMDVEKFGTVIS